MRLDMLSKSPFHWTVTVLFVGLLIALAVPAEHGPAPFTLVVLVVAAEAIRRVHGRLRPRAAGRVTASDLAALVYGVLLVWQLSTAHVQMLDAVFFAPPETILRLFFREVPTMTKGAVSSLAKLLSGFLLALIAGAGFGVLFGSHRRLFNAATPFAKALGPIPPIIYVPYAICFLPGLVSAQIFVIFVGVFWPVFLSTLNGIQNIPGSQLDTARTLNLTGRRLQLKILLPGALPSICAGAMLGLVFGFILLTAAELIGSSSGVGWYIKNYADYGDFKRVIVGVIFVGVLVLVVTAVTDRIERRLLHWYN